MFDRVLVDGIEIAPGPRRARVLLPSPEGRVGLYTPRDKLLAALVDTATVVPFDQATGEHARSSAGWLR
ncbi:MAG: hypothetical protein ACRDQB_08325 [Thermocrispum sp.]